MREAGRVAASSARMVVAAALLRRLRARACSQLPVDDRVRVAAKSPSEEEPDAARGGLLGDVVADVAVLPFASVYCATHRRLCLLHDTVVFAKGARPAEASTAVVAPVVR